MEKITSKTTALKLLNITNTNFELFKIYSHLSQDLKEDKDILIKYISKDEKAILILNNKEMSRDFWLDAVVANHKIALNVPCKYSDSEFWLSAIAKKPIVLFNAPLKYLENKDFNLEAVKVNPYCARYIYSKFRKDDEFVDQVIEILKNSVQENKETYDSIDRIIISLENSNKRTSKTEQFVQNYFS